MNEIKLCLNSQEMKKTHEFVDRMLEDVRKKEREHKELLKAFIEIFQELRVVVKGEFSNDIYEDENYQHYIKMIEDITGLKWNKDHD